jgi:hypothetical protein
MNGPYSSVDTGACEPDAPGAPPWGFRIAVTAGRSKSSNDGGCGSDTGRDDSPEL